MPSNDVVCKKGVLFCSKCCNTSVIFSSTLRNLPIVPLIDLIKKNIIKTPTALSPVPTDDILSHISLRRNDVESKAVILDYVPISVHCITRN